MDLCGTESIECTTHRLPLLWLEKFWTKFTKLLFMTQRFDTPVLSFNLTWVFKHCIMNGSFINYIQQISIQSRIKPCLIVQLVALEICSIIFRERQNDRQEQLLYSHLYLPSGKTIFNSTGQCMTNMEWTSYIWGRNHNCEVAFWVRLQYVMLHIKKQKALTYLVHV